MLRIAAIAALSLLISPALAAVKPVQPDDKPQQPSKFNHTPKACDTTKPREIIRLNLFKMDKDGRLIPVGVVMIPKGC